MSKVLRVAPDLTFPAQAVTETFGILAVRGAGKSNTAAVMAEEMFAAQLPFVVVDPVRAWWGLRASRDGTGPGLPIPIFGGRRGDVPLERGAGNLMADLIVDQRLSCVLDLSDFDSEGSKKAFLLDFARRLYQRNEQPLHLFLEEADDYIPQRPMRDEAQLLRAWENIVRRGRNRGLGMTLITQRSASINKSVLTQVQTLIAMRTTGPQDIAAVREWVKYHQQQEEILGSLAELKDGEAWVWSPQFLGKTVRVRFRRRETFDSGATPKLGQSEKAPGTLADIDLADVKERMAATIERAKADDPRELRKQIAELKKAKAVAPAPDPRAVEMAVEAARRSAEKQWVEERRTLKREAEQLAAKLHKIAALVHENMERQVPEPIRVSLPPPDREPANHRAPVRTTVTPSGTSTLEATKLAGGERRILTALAQYPQGRTKVQVAILAGYKHSGGGYNNYLGSLRTAGLIAGSGDQLLIAEQGLEALGPYEPLPTGRELAEHWLRQLGKAERLILQVLLDAYPSAMSKESVAAAAGYEASGGGFNNALGKLRTLELIWGRGELRASEELVS